ncbi:MAG TPA: hypothetical protein VEK07_22500 [Polyangiaceae bacterium]|nr:hypothetical protein [Polyangiaceae bacterium]
MYPTNPRPSRRRALDVDRPTHEDARLGPRRLSIAFAFATTLVGSRVSAQSATPADAGRVAFSADEVRLDPATKTLDATGHVRVDEPPFHFTSDALRLKRVPQGVLLDGTGQLAFCPCLGTPLSLKFSGATVAPPHEVVLRNPVLQIFGLPIGWLPLVWLRSPARIGLLPPELSWRGADGFFAGGGVHFPWRSDDLSGGLDLRAGGYVDGGAAVDAVLRTPTTVTHLLWDRLHGNDGVTLGARGSSVEDGAPAPKPGPIAAWDIDALRGARAVQATTAVDAAAQPFDRASGDAQWRADGWTFASGVRAMAARGTSVGEAGAWGPIATVRRSDAIADVGAYDVGVEGGGVAEGSDSKVAPPPGGGATSFVRGEANLLLGTRIGAIGSGLALHGFGDVADDGAAVGMDGAAQARASATLPLVREFESSDAADPWVHRTEPRLELAVVVAHESGILATPAGRGMQVASGAAWVGAAGWSNTVGRWGSRTALDVDVSAGALGGEGRTPLAMIRARASVTGPYLALRADVARVLAPSIEPSDAGGILLAAARIGPATGLHVSANVAQRDGTDPIAARALVDPSYEAASGFLVASGWTGGSRVGVPIGSRVTARAGVDVDLDARELVAAATAIELHDSCNCVVIRATAAHRLGRPGIDASVSVELPLSAR